MLTNSSIRRPDVGLWVPAIEQLPDTPIHSSGESEISQMILFYVDDCVHYGYVKKTFSWTVDEMASTKEVDFFFVEAPTYEHTPYWVWPAEEVVAWMLLPFPPNTKIDVNI